ncbi:MAG TPA: hypothetical protein VMU51_32805 [Mycobacteriales bacterium]|nr:hypothetical protein [Mycobacteriales bacterium]
MRDPRERPESTVMGAAAHSAEESRQLLPLNHPARRRFRVTAALAGVATAVWGVVGVGSDRVTIALVVAGVLAILVSLPGGNVGAASSIALGSVIIVGGLLQLGITDTSANTLHASVLNVCGFLLLGLVVGGCGLYEWETDEHGRMVRGIRSVSRNVRAELNARTH